MPSDANDTTCTKFGDPSGGHHFTDRYDAGPLSGVHRFQQRQDASAAAARRFGGFQIFKNIKVVGPEGFTTAQIAQLRPLMPHAPSLLEDLHASDPHLENNGGIVPAFLPTPAVSPNGGDLGTVSFRRREFHGLLPNAFKSTPGYTPSRSVSTWTG